MNATLDRIEAKLDAARGLLTRADAGLNIIMKHTNINTGGSTMIERKDAEVHVTGQATETDQQRQTRTGLSSLEITDDEAAAVQKSHNRVTLESMLDKVEDIEFIHPRTFPHMTICVMTVENGFALVGKSAPADPENFNDALGEKFSKEDAIRQMWALEAYLLRERMRL